MPDTQKEFTSEIVSRSTEGFDPGDKAIAMAIRDFNESVESSLAESSVEILHTIQSPGAINALISANRAKIELVAHRFRVQMAERRYELKSSELHLLIAESEIGFDHTLDYTIDVAGRIQRDNGQETMEKVFAIAKSVVESSTSEGLDRLAQGIFPEAVDEAAQAWDETKQFLRDLAGVIKGDDHNHRLANEVCKDTAFAAEVEEDSDLPEALQFLAHLARQFVEEGGDELSVN